MKNNENQNGNNSKSAVMIPNYRKIYTDMISMKYPEKAALCEKILRKKFLTVMDLIELNGYLSNTLNADYNQKLKCYDRDSIFKILEDQKHHRLNNTQAAKKFSVSRNTLCKWKRIYLSVDTYSDK